MILVTGGAGYIGSHTCVELLQEGYEICIVDNFVNSNPSVLDRIKKITGKSFAFEEADITDAKALDAIFSQYPIDAVIHFAGLKAVGESVEKPLLYYSNNLIGSIELAKAMARHQVKQLIFSSSATVYRQENPMPLDEGGILGCTNPYGWTKYMAEQIFRDMCKADAACSVVLLRYFNPIGAHKSGLIGEDPKGIPNNLLPYIAKVAAGELKELSVFGDDYPTKDGTGVRDYIHVVDLAKGHVRALDYMKEHKGAIAINLGTGNGLSVLEIVRAFEKASGVPVPYRIAPRRPGDIATCYAKTDLAKELLHWQAEYDVNDMCADTWRWQQSQK